MIGLQYTAKQQSISKKSCFLLTSVLVTMTTWPFLPRKRHSMHNLTASSTHPFAYWFVVVLVLLVKVCRSRNCSKRSTIMRVASTNESCFSHPTCKTRTFCTGTAAFLTRLTMPWRRDGDGLFSMGTSPIRFVLAAIAVFLHGWQRRVHVRPVRALLREILSVLTT